jgi:hypothetical protein
MHAQITVASSDMQRIATTESASKAQNSMSISQIVHSRESVGFARGMAFGAVPAMLLVILLQCNS